MASYGLRRILFVWFPRAATLTYCLDAGGNVCLAGKLISLNGDTGSSQLSVSLHFLQVALVRVAPKTH